MNVGAFRPVAVRAPEGSFVNPRPPAGGGPRAIACTRIFEVGLGALGLAVPDAVTAANSHFCNATFGAYDPERAGSSSATSSCTAAGAQGPPGTAATR